MVELCPLAGQGGNLTPLIVTSFPMTTTPLFDEITEFLITLP